MYDLILVRYGEMTLKKINYKQFQMKLNDNIKRKLRDFKNLKFNYSSYRFYIYLNNEDHNKVIDVLNTVVGLHSYSLCKYVNPVYDEIANSAIALINEVCNNVEIPVYVMVRPHGKSFIYNENDIKVILNDIKAITKTKAKGIVFGALNNDLTINESLLKQIIDIKSHLKLTFHRAFDKSNDIFKRHRHEYVPKGKFC